MKKGVVSIIMTVMMIFGCVACDKEKDFEIPEVITILRSEGQHDAPEFKFLSEYDPVNLEDDRIKAMSFKNVKNTSVFAYFGMPETASEENKVPAVVLVHGGGGTAFPEWVQMWVDAGYAAIAIDTEGKVNVNGSSAQNPQSTVVRNFYGGPFNDSLSQTHKDIDKQWMYFAVSAAMNANSLLRNDHRIDKTKIGITGISWGGVITSVAMCADERFAFAVPLYCNGNYTKGNMQTLMYDCYSNEKASELWDPKNYFQLVKAKVLFVNADHDFSHPMVGTNTSHSQIKDSYQTILPDLQHSHIDGWGVKETMAFANSVVGKGENKLVRVTSQKVKNGKVNITFSTDENVKIVNAEMYAIKGDYDINTQTNTGYVCALKEDFRYMDEQSITTQGEVSMEIPKNATYIYVNLISEDGYVSSGNMIKL